jgi:hypothetical protein
MLLVVPFGLHPVMERRTRANRKQGSGIGTRRRQTAARMNTRRTIAFAKCCSAIRPAVLAAPGARACRRVADKDGVTEQPVVGPGEIGDLGDENGSNPMDARQREATAEARLARRRDGERGSFDRERRETRVQRGERLLRHAGSASAGVENTPVVVVIGEQKRAEIGSRPFRVGPAGDDEFVAVEAFRFDSGAAVA